MVQEDIEAIEHPALFIPLIYIYLIYYTLSLSLSLSLSHTHTHTQHPHTHIPQAEGNSDGRPGKSARACLTHKKKFTQVSALPHLHVKLLYSGLLEQRVPKAWPTARSYSAGPYHEAGPTTCASRVVSQA
jgi:hypothetical protein